MVRGDHKPVLFWDILEASYLHAGNQVDDEANEPT
jgi:hypothetical protein